MVTAQDNIKIRATSILTKNHSTNQNPTNRETTFKGKTFLIQVVNFQTTSTICKIWTELN